MSYDLHDGALRIQWGGDHTQCLARGEPLLVLDMYEHSDHMCCGGAAVKYVEAFMRNVDWEVVSRRYETAVRLDALVRA